MLWWILMWSNRRRIELSLSLVYRIDINGVCVCVWTYLYRSACKYRHKDTLLFCGNLIFSLHALFFHSRCDRFYQCHSVPLRQSVFRILKSDNFNFIAAVNNSTKSTINSLLPIISYSNDIWKQLRNVVVQLFISLHFLNEMTRKRKSINSNDFFEIHTKYISLMSTVISYTNNHWEWWHREQYFLRPF